MTCWQTKTLHVWYNEQNKYVSLECKVHIKYQAFLLIIFSPGNTTLIIRENVGLIAKLCHSVPQPVLLNIHNSLIHPYLTYCLAAWGQACKTHLQKILILQKRALCLLYFADWHDHATPLFLEANMLPITFLHYEFVSTLMQDINDNKAQANLLN